MPPWVMRLTSLATWVGTDIVAPLRSSPCTSRADRVGIS